MKPIGLVGGQRAGLDPELHKDVPVGARGFGAECELIPKVRPVMRMAGERVPEPLAGLQGLTHRNRALARRVASLRSSPSRGSPQSSSEHGSLSGACSATEDPRSLRSRRVITTPKTARNAEDTVPPTRQRGPPVSRPPCPLRRGPRCALAAAPRGYRRELRGTRSTDICFSRSGCSPIATDFAGNYRRLARGCETHLTDGCGNGISDPHSWHLR